MKHHVMRDDGTVLQVQAKIVKRASSKAPSVVELTKATEHDDGKPVALTRLTKAERQRFEAECAEVYDEGRAG